MAAMGLAALGNLNGDKQMQHLSKMQYGEALARTNETLKDPVNNLEAAIRTTVMLALFQVISVDTHPAPLWPRSKFAKFEENADHPVAIDSVFTPLMSLMSLPECIC